MLSPREIEVARRLRGLVDNPPPSVEEWQRLVDEEADRLEGKLEEVDRVRSRRAA